MSKAASVAIAPPRLWPQVVKRTLRLSTAVSRSVRTCERMRLLMPLLSHEARNPASCSGFRVRTYKHANDRMQVGWCVMMQRTASQQVRNSREKPKETKHTHTHTHTHTRTKGRGLSLHGVLTHVHCAVRDCSYHALPPPPHTHTRKDTKQPTAVLHAHLGEREDSRRHACGAVGVRSE